MKSTRTRNWDLLRKILIAASYAFYLLSLAYFSKSIQNSAATLFCVLAAYEIGFSNGRLKAKEELKLEAKEEAKIEKQEKDEEVQIGWS